MDDGLETLLHSEVPLKDLDTNITKYLLQAGTEDGEVNVVADPEYEQFLADVWVGIVLTLIVLSCVCFMCSCLIYHKFQEWKTRVMEARNAANLESGTADSDLPSYTVASGLPTYQEALEQLRKVKELNRSEAKTSDVVEGAARTPQTLTVFNLFQIYRNDRNIEGGGESKPS